MKIDVRPSVQQYDIQLGVTPPTIHHVGLGTNIIVRGSAPHYEGEYEFTPTQSTQIAHTEDRLCDHDIIINPIPSNYGLITWDGQTLTVS